MAAKRCIIWRAGSGNARPLFGLCGPCLPQRNPVQVSLQICLRVDVGGRIAPGDRQPACLLRTHVRGSPQNDAAACQLRRAGERRRIHHRSMRLGRRIESFRQTEIEHLRDAVRSQLDVGGLQISMNNPLLVRRLQRLGHLSCDRARVSHGERPLGDRIGKRWSFDQFEDERVRRSAVFETVDMANIGVAQGGKHLCFVSKTRQAIVIAREDLWKNLESNVAIEFGVAGAIDLAHSASAERCHHFERADQIAWCKSHERRPKKYDVRA